MLVVAVFEEPDFVIGGAIGEVQAGGGGGAIL
jgi:hypothetical protein